MPDDLVPKPMVTEPVVQPTPATQTPPPSKPARQTPAWLRGLLIVIIVLAIGIVAGAGGLLLWQSHNDSSASITNHHTSIATPSATPTPTIAKISQTVLFYDKRGGISMADDTGSNVVRIVEGESASFAGLSANKSTIYYDQLDQATKKVGLFAYNLNTKKAIKLTDFTPTLSTGDPDNPIYLHSSSVRPDGKFALLATNKGIELLNLSNKTQKKILGNESSGEDLCGYSVKAPSNWLSWLVRPAYAANVGCERYLNPQYSADGAQALVVIGYYESSEFILINPMTGETLKKWGTYRGVYMRQDWKALVVSGEGGDLGSGLNYYTSLNSSPIDLLADRTAFADSDNTFGETWSSNNKVFFVVNQTGWVINPSDQTKHLVSKDLSVNITGIDLWLKDNISVLVADTNKVWQINTQTGTQTIWSDQALSPIVLLK